MATSNPTNGNDSCEAAGKSPSSSQAVHGQSKEAKAAQPPPERRGFSWTESDYEAMVSGLRAGQSLYKISKALERTGGAVLSRVEHLLPDPIPLDIPGDRDAQLEYLRRLLVEDKDYQWFELAQLRAHRDGRIVWTTDDDRRLRDAWDKGQPTLAELAQSFNTRPSFVAKHIVELTEASNNAEVEARLGDSSAASIPEPIQSVSPETVTPTTTPGRGSTGIANPEVVDSYSAGTGTEGALYRSLVDCFATAQQRLWIKVPWWDTSPAASRLIDEAMIAIEKRNETLKGVLPKDYARPALNAVMLGELIDLQRSLECFAAAGAREIALPPNGRVQCPKLTGGSTAGTTADTTAATTGDTTAATTAGTASNASSPRGKPRLTQPP